MVVAAMRSTMIWWVFSGRPRQLVVIWERRYSVLFHFEVPGGRWATLTCRPVSAAKAASSTFQVRTLDPFDPPQSALFRRGPLDG